MALRTTLAVLAGLSGALFLNAPLCQGAPPQARAAADGKLTLVFSNVQVTEVLERLKTQGVNFVVGQGELEANRTITLNLIDQPREVAMDLLAEALGGRWERRGEVYLYRKGTGDRPPMHGAPIMEKAAVKRDGGKTKPQPKSSGPGSERILVSYSLTSPIGSRARAFLDSLTQAQIQKHGSRGYLLASELTMDQRKLIGGMDALRGRLDVRLGVDKESVTIKSDIPAVGSAKPATKKPVRRPKTRRRG